VYENKTPKGYKKLLEEPMPATYDPPAVEAAWYDWWSAEVGLKR
jgi:valyl-tRNA synthetase